MNEFIQDGSLLDALVYADWLEDQGFSALAEEAREQALDSAASESDWYYEQRHGVGASDDVGGGGVDGFDGVGCVGGVDGVGVGASVDGVGCVGGGVGRVGGDISGGGVGVGGSR